MSGYPHLQMFNYLQSLWNRLGYFGVENNGGKFVANDRFMKLKMSKIQIIRSLIIGRILIKLDLIEN